jgi:hypothetical protein
VHDTVDRQWHTYIQLISAIENKRKKKAINLLAYNNIRGSLAKAGSRHAKIPRQLSFRSALQLLIQSSKQVVRLTATNKSLAGSIESDDSNVHWKTKTKESTKGSQVPAKTISFADDVKKRIILNGLCMLNFYCSSIRI